MNQRKTVHARDFPHRPGWFRIVNTVWKKTYPLGSRPSLDRDDLIKAARKATGLQDLGKEFREEPLDRLLRSLNEEARLHPIGRFISRQRIVNLLAVRLRAEQWFRKHPGILDQEVHPPVVIVGLQRTGTTKLHRLLTADPDNRVLRSWEAINPAPFSMNHDGRDKRIRVARTSERALRMMAPGFFTIHPVEHTAPEEDILLLDATFLSTTPEAITHVPSYAAWLEETDQSPAYEYGSKLLRLLQWQEPGKRWILKSPHHLEFLHLVRKHYGEPHFLWTHREITECIPSFLSMVCHSRAIFSNEVSIEEVAEHWVRKTSYMLEKAMSFRRQEGHEGYFTDVLYESLVNDPMGQLKEIYARYGGIPSDLAGRFRVADSENPRDKYGIHQYSFADFGLEKEELMRKNGSYYQFYTSLIQAGNPES